ncbi:MAG TPA: SDR family oxidoreductase [Candidatus Limnocylindrales bacterium]|nr:SDR family oxidoreductase [Candidatus Limnocylindrales bacterium]
MDQIWYGLKDKVFVVTGGSRGIGLGLSRQLLTQKAKVVFCARKQDGLDSALVELGGGGDSVLAVAAHIAREEDVENIFRQTMERFGRVDALVNNVGMNLLTPSLADTSTATWQKIIDSNLTGTYHCSKAAAVIMKEQRSGKIVNISSIAACRPAPGMGVYGVAKAGIEMLTKVLAAELAAYNIQVNAVAPCMVKTGFSEPFWSNEDVCTEIVRRIPLGRLAEVGDIIHPVLFLCSDGADFITGQVVAVDGGATTI